MKTSLPRRCSPRRFKAGVTLVEAATAVAVVAAAAGLTVPSFERSVQRRHLEGAAAQLETDIHYARSMAVARNMPLRVSFSAGNGSSCYVIHTGAAQCCGCAADGTAACQGSAEALRSVRFAPGDAVSLRSNAGSVLFDPVRGTSTPTATIQLQTASGMGIRQVLNVLGRVRSCSPTPALSGYAAC